MFENKCSGPGCLPHSAHNRTRNLDQIKAYAHRNAHANGGRNLTNTRGARTSQNRPGHTFFVGRWTDGTSAGITLRAEALYSGCFASHCLYNRKECQKLWGLMSSLIQTMDLGESSRGAKGEKRSRMEPKRQTGTKNAHSRAKGHSRTKKDIPKLKRHFNTTTCSRREAWTDPCFN